MGEGQVKAAVLTRVREVTGRRRKLTDEVEIDETYVGWKERNKYASKRLKAGRGAVGKTVVIGAKERDEKVKASVIEKPVSATLKGFVLDNVETGAAAFTGEHSGYRGLSASLAHSSVRHSVGEYVNGMAKTNGIESFWAMLERVALMAKGLDGKRLRYDDLVAVS